MSVLNYHLSLVLGRVDKSALDFMPTVKRLHEQRTELRYTSLVRRLASTTCEVAMRRTESFRLCEELGKGRLLYN